MEEDSGRDHGRGSMEEASGKHLGSIWEASGGHLGGIWETSWHLWVAGRHLEASGAKSYDISSQGRHKIDENMKNIEKP